MAIEIKAPSFPESVADGTIASWHKQVGEAVRRDELLVEIETDKIVLEIVAVESGTLTEIIRDVGETVESNELLGMREPGAAAADTAPTDHMANVQLSGFVVSHIHHRVASTRQPSHRIIAFSGCRNLHADIDMRL